MKEKNIENKENKKEININIYIKDNKDIQNGLKNNLNNLYILNDQRNDFVETFIINKSFNLLGS